LVVFILAIPTKETFKPIILKKRALKRGITPPNATDGAVVKKTLLLNVFRPLHMLVSEPVVFFFSVYTAFVFAILFMFFAAIPYIFSRRPYEFTVSQNGLVFIAIGLGVLLAGATGLLIDQFVYQAQNRKAIAAGNAHAQPEHRLYNAMLGSLGIPIGLFWFGWTANAGVHWAVPIVGSVPFAWGNLCLFVSHDCVFPHSICTRC